MSPLLRRTVPMSIGSLLAVTCVVIAAIAVTAIAAASRVRNDVRALNASHRALEIETANYRAALEALIGEIGSAPFASAHGSDALSAHSPGPASPVSAAAATFVRVADAAVFAADRERLLQALTRLERTRASAEAADAPLLASRSYRAGVALEGEAQELSTVGQATEALLRAVEADACFRAAEIEARAEAAAAERLRLADAAIARPSAADARNASLEPLTRGDIFRPPLARVAPVADAEAPIREVISQYVSGLESRSLATLKRVWPTLGGSQERAIQTEFANARTVQTLFTDPRISIDGDTTTVTGFRTYRLVTHDGQHLSSMTRTTLTLRRNGDSWVIERIVHQQ